MIPVKLRVETNQSSHELKVRSTSIRHGLSPATEVKAYIGPYYTGAYTVTPTQSTQTLNTDNLRLTDNVTINPIPSNYGLVTWNGSYLKVS